MFSVGAGFGLLVLAIYFAFLAENRWHRIIGSLYIGLFFVLSVIAAFQSTEPGLHLVIPGLPAIVMLCAYGIIYFFDRCPFAPPRRGICARRSKNFVGLETCS
jgi:hypothetical protein